MPSHLFTIPETLQPEERIRTVLSLSGRTNTRAARQLAGVWSWNTFGKEKDQLPQTSDALHLDRSWIRFTTQSGSDSGTQLFPVHVLASRSGTLQAVVWSDRSVNISFARHKDLQRPRHACVVSPHAFDLHPSVENPQDIVTLLDAWEPCVPQLPAVFLKPITIKTIETRYSLGDTHRHLPWACGPGTSWLNASALLGARALVFAFLQHRHRWENPGFQPPLTHTQGRLSEEEQITFQTFAPNGKSTPPKFTFPNKPTSFVRPDVAKTLEKAMNRRLREILATTDGFLLITGMFGWRSGDRPTVCSSLFRWAGMDAPMSAHQRATLHKQAGDHSRFLDGVLKTHHL